MTLASGRRRNVPTMRTGRLSTSGRFFAGPVEEPRARRASDVLLAVGATAGLVALGWASAPSFYLPPTWGWFAFRWLQTNKYL
jgi:hypothetical protein